MARPARVATGGAPAPLAPAPRRGAGPAGAARRGPGQLHLRPRRPDAEPGRAGRPVRPGPGGQPRPGGTSGRADLYQRPAGRGPGGGRRGGGGPVRLLRPGAHRLLRPAVRRRRGRGVGEHLRRAAPAGPGAPGTAARRHDPRPDPALARRAPVPPRPPAAAAGLQRRAPPVRPQSRHRRAARQGGAAGARAAAGLPRPGPPIRSPPPGPALTGHFDTAGAAGLESALRQAVGGEVRFDAYTRHLFSRDASMYAIEPIGVVFPRDGSEAAAVVATAAEFGVPVLPRGAGTSLAGQTVGRAVVMDFTRHMHKILAIDAEARRARVQPGVVQEQLNLVAARHGLTFGPDTSTGNRATLGGMIGNNSAGSHSVRYGMTVDHVLALDVVLSDASTASLGALPEAELAARAARPTLEGAICRGLPALAARNAGAIATGYPRFWRQSGGYRLDRLAGRDGLDLAAFVTGSEGTLVTVVEAAVALVPAPQHRVIAVGHFTSVQAAIEATGDALAGQPLAV